MTEASMNLLESVWNVLKAVMSGPGLKISFRIEKITPDR